ncbi:N-formylglutamate amidohydrolase [Fulvivirga lutea]|uniref:N-formylglutamate amidohydrolase n=1 Tax=Fulvivirga lutea TaxID=2810512 RepID=A0A974WHI8_9BACT|nr:N-formylglutamate amidohydrolase [Fulvivirga lutea]QSE97999.1 N-formylglutamate amidohydrolase [Fulvivirga lutea]
MQIAPYNIIQPIGKRVPMIVSSPHSGVQFPDELKDHYNQQLIATPDDTDWFIHQLYDFAPEMGITMIAGNYSRWVIDLNRNPDSQPLYNDGRIITELCPTKSFAGEEIYKSGKQPKEKEVERRLETYYWPYYQKIQELIDDLKNEFGYVIFWDAHSIRKYVPLIRKDDFPELILGDNEGVTASKKLSDLTLQTLQHRGHQINYNDPFKGGHLTRYFGKPEQNQHALQLEMTKVNYMDDSETEYHKPRASRMRESLSLVFEELINTEL